MACTPARPADAAATSRRPTAACRLQSTPPTFHRVDWDWGDGTSTLVTTGSPLSTRTYTQAGTYLLVATATVRTPDAGDRTATLTRPLTIP